MADDLQFSMKKIKLLFKNFWRWILKSWRNYVIQRILVIIAFLLGLSIIYYLFIIKDIASNNSDRITFLIGSFGILFTIIQFFLNSLSNKLTFIKKLRYEEYVKLKEIIDEFSNYVMEDLGNVEKSRYLKGKLYLTCREFKARIDTANKYVFPNIASHRTARKVEQNLLFIVHEAIGFDMKKNELPIGVDGKIIDKKQLSVLAIKWIKNTNPYINTPVIFNNEFNNNMFVKTCLTG